MKTKVSFILAIALTLGLALNYSNVDAQRKSKRKTTHRTTTTRKKTTARRSTASVDTAGQNRAIAPIGSPATAAVADQDSLPKDAPIDTIKPVDGFYKNTSYDKAKAFAYPPIDRNQVKFYKRVWREIDVHNPKNQIFDTPGATLADIIFEGVKTGRLTAYDPELMNPSGDNTFKKRLNYKEAMGSLRDSAMVDQFDKDGNKIGSKMVLNDFNPEKISRFRIKEDIFYDKKRSLVVTRIIGIAPLKEAQAAGQTIGYTPIFWLYFPQARNYFASKDVSDPDHNLYDMTLDDVFLQRRFTSTIVRATGSAGLLNQQMANSAVPTTAPAAGAGGAAGLPVDPTAQAVTAPSIDGKAVEARIGSFENNLWDYQTQSGTNAATIAAESVEKPRIKTPKAAKATKTTTTTSTAKTSSTKSKKKQS
jgi:gliding motility associated protien GldN